MAPLTTRRPQVVIHHSDQGSHYTSLDFGKRGKEMGVRPSMGSVGDAYDNAMAESFFASLECELINWRSWKSFAEARMAVFTWIEGGYNPGRRHSGMGQKSPINFEKELQAKGRTSTATTPEHGVTQEVLRTCRQAAFWARQRPVPLSAGKPLG